MNCCKCGKKILSGIITLDKKVICKECLTKHDKEKIESCKHEKVYSNIALTSNPPQRKWICRICGEQGIDVGEVHNNQEYERLIEEWRDKHEPLYDT